MALLGVVPAVALGSSAGIVETRCERSVRPRAMHISAAALRSLTDLKSWMPYEEEEDAADGGGRVSSPSVHQSSG